MRNRPGAATKARELGEWLFFGRAAGPRASALSVANRAATASMISASARGTACCSAAIRSTLPSDGSHAHSTGSSGLAGKPLMDGHASRSLSRDVRASISDMPPNGWAHSLLSVSAAWARAVDDGRAGAPTASLKGLRPMPPRLYWSWTCTFCMSVSSHTPMTSHTARNNAVFPCRSGTARFIRIRMVLRSK